MKHWKKKLEVQHSTSLTLNIKRENTNIGWNIIH